MSGDKKESNPAEDALKGAAKTAVATGTGAALGLPPEAVKPVTDAVVDTAADKASKALSEGPKPGADKKDSSAPNEGPKPGADKSDKKENDSSAPKDWATSMGQIQDRANEQAKEMGADKFLYNSDEGGKSGLRQGLSPVGSGFSALKSKMFPGPGTKQTTELSPESLGSLPTPTPKAGGGNGPGGPSPEDLINPPTPGSKM